MFLFKFIDSLNSCLPPFLSSLLSSFSFLKLSCCCSFETEFLLCSTPDCPGTGSVDQTGFRFRDRSFLNIQETKCLFLPVSGVVTQYGQVFIMPVNQCAHSCAHVHVARISVWLWIWACNNRHFIQVRAFPFIFIMEAQNWISAQIPGMWLLFFY